MVKLSQWASRILWAALGFTICAVAVGHDIIRIDPTFTFGNLIQAFATVSVGVVVAAYFQRILQSDRKEKDLLLGHLSDMLDMLGEIELFKTGGSLAEVAATIKRFSLRTKFTSSLLSEFKYSPEIIVELGLDEEIRELRKLATDTPINELEQLAGDKRKPSKVREGFIELAEEKKLLLENKVHDLKMKISKAQVLLNRA